MKNIGRLLVILSLGSSLLQAKTLAEKSQDFIYLSKTFQNIAIDNSTEVTKSLYGKIYKANNPPSINLAKTAQEYLKINEMTTANYGTVKGWERVEQINGAAGLIAVVFKKSQHIIISFRGAEVGVSDWITDGMIQNNEIASAYLDAVEIVEKYSADYPNHEISISGYSLGGSVATFVGLMTNKKTYTFNHLALNKKSIAFIQERIKIQGYAANTLGARAKNLTHFAFVGEFVADGDRQQDGDTIFKHQIIGDIYYLSDKRFNAIVFNNRIFRHLFSPIREELAFLSNPYYRQNRFDASQQNNTISTWRARFYYDDTWDDFDLYGGLNTYILHSIPSLIQDIIKYSK